MINPGQQLKNSGPTDGLASAEPSGRGVDGECSVAEKPLTPVQSLAVAAGAAAVYGVFTRELPSPFIGEALKDLVLPGRDVKGTEVIGHIGTAPITIGAPDRMIGNYVKVVAGPTLSLMCVASAAYATFSAGRWLDQKTGMLGFMAQAAHKSGLVSAVKWITNRD